MSRTDYDVLIIGAGIGGLTAGSLLAKTGAKVLILEQRETPGGCCSSFLKNGYRFDLGASLFSGFEKDGPLRKIFLGLGMPINTADKKRGNPIKLNPGFQVVLPDHRLNIYSERERLFSELKREFYYDFGELKSFYDNMDKIETKAIDFIDNIPEIGSNKGFKKQLIYLKNNFGINLSKQYREMSYYTGKWALQPGTGSFFDIQTMFFLQDRLINCSPLSAAVAMGTIKRGLFYVIGGAQALIDKYLWCFKKYNGHISLGKKVDKIIFEDKKAIGVKLSDGGIIKAKYVISDVPRWNMEMLINKQDQKRKIRKRINMPKPQYVVFTVYLGIDREVIPVGMKENVFMLSDYKMLFGGSNLMFITVSPSWDEECAPQGKAVLKATCFFNSAEWFKSNDYNSVEKIKTEEVIKNLNKLIPFLDKHIDCVETINPLAYEKFTLRENGFIGGFNKINKPFSYQSILDYNLQKNVFLVGDTTFPGHGVTAAAISGLNVAKIIAGMIGY